MLRTHTGIVALYIYDGTGDPIALLLRDIGGNPYTYTYDPYGLPTLRRHRGRWGHRCETRRLDPR